VEVKKSGKMAYVMFRADQSRDIFVVVVAIVSAKIVLKNVRQLTLAKSASQKAR
jgi:hypothetical protein